MRPTKRVKRYLVFVLARALTSVVFLLPTSAALALARAVGRAAFWLAAPLRRRAVAQLEARLGLPPDEARATARAVFENAAMIGAEIVLLPRLRRRFEAYVELPPGDLAVLEAAVAEGRGVVFVTGHVGNWELLAQRITRAGFEAATLARRAPNPYLGGWLLERRRAGGLDTINRGDPKAARRMLGTLKRGALLGVLIDQDTRVDSVHVPFFGAPAATPTAAAEIALRKDAVVVLGFIRRKPGRVGHIVRLERAGVGDLPDGDRTQRVRALTAHLTARIEAAIREAPAEWVWFHDRWKTPREDPPS